MTPDLKGLPPLLFRGDASATIGTGHVMRCLAMAQAWKRAGGEAVFAIAESPEALIKRFVDDGFSTISFPVVPASSDDFELLLSHVRRLDAKWVVIDGDHFDSEFLLHLHDSGIRTLLLDDFVARPAFPADIVLNPNYGAKEEPYRLSGFRGELLLGESYVLLRSEFTSRASTGDRIVRRFGNKILITLGGSDPDNLSARILEAIAELTDFEIRFIAGAGYAHVTDLTALTGGNVQVLYDAPDMPTLMRKADMAIIAGGGTLWELLYMGCAVLSYSRNSVQAVVLRELAEKGILMDMGPMLHFSGPALVAKIRELANSDTIRKGMADAGQRLIDGRGAQRIVEKLTACHCGLAG
jgi:UDP-2,4-diacetamido-2,4,6-trideoxy-beta-L-altropyranose hydrolase